MSVPDYSKPVFGARNQNIYLGDPIPRGVVALNGLCSVHVWNLVLKCLLCLRREGGMITLHILFPTF